MATDDAGVEYRIARNRVDDVEILTLYVGTRYGGGYGSFATARLCAELLRRKPTNTEEAT